MSIIYGSMVGGGGSGGSSITIDETLTAQGKAADAKAVGDRLYSLSEEITSVKIISYTQFGAALDGISDDTEAAIACHQYANANGCRVEQHSGTLYLKTATEENCPIVKTSCDWSGMTFKVDEHMGKNIIMKVVPDEGVQSHSLTSEEIGELTKGTVQIPFLVDYKNCICHFTTDISIGNRLNKTGSYVYHETVTVDRYGNLLEGELFRAMSDAKAINMEYQSIFQRPVTLEGARIVLDTADDSKIPCILVKRSNTTLKDWTLVIEREVSSDSTEYKGEILKVENCYNVVIEKFSGENFGTFFSQEAEDKSETCYMVYLSGLSRFTMRDCLMIRAWGVVQSQYCKDMIFKDSTLGRIDNHYGCRNYTVNNCTITSSHSTINIGYGDGQFIIDNVRFVKFADPDTVFQKHCILLRGDFCALYSGELVINNITINNYSGQAINLLSGSYSDSFDFGDSAAILPLEFPEVKINNVVYDTDDVTIVNFKVTKDSYAATQNLPIKAKLVSIENVKVKDNTTKHLRLTVHYGYLDQVTQLDHYGVRMRIPWKSNWITNVSGSILAMDSHINNFNGTIGDTLQLENCYVYSYATTWQYVRDMVLHNCHVYVGSNSTVKFNCNHSFRCTSTVFEERVQSTRFEAIQVPDLYYFKDCYCISSKLDDELASKLVDSNTITNSGILLKSENMPRTLPNPNALTFTGAVAGSYDGSKALTVKIPQGGGGLSDYELIDTLDWSTEELAQLGAGKEYSFEGIQDIVLVYTGLANTTTTVSGLTVTVNNITLQASAEPMSGKSGTPMNGYVFLHSIPGIGLFSLKSPGANTSNSYTATNAQISYNLYPVTGKITQFKIHNRALAYCTNTGILKIYVR